MLPNKRKSYKFFIIWILGFFGFFVAKIWQNPNLLMKFTEIWYVVAFQQKKMLQAKLFWDFGLFWPFCGQKTAKIDKK